MRTADDQTLKLAVDLSARNSYLDTAAAQRIGAISRAPSPDLPVQQILLHQVHIGTAGFADFPFKVFDLTPDPAASGAKVKPEKLPADGALGAGAFQDRLLILDISHHLLRFSDPQPSPAVCPGNCGQLVWKHFQSFGALALTVQGFEVNAAPIDAQIDTLFAGTVLLYPQATERLKLKKVSRSKDKVAFPYVQNGILLLEGEGTTQGFRGVTLATDAPIYFWGDKSEAPGATQFDATVGTALLAHGIATFDFTGMQFWVT